MRDMIDSCINAEPEQRPDISYVYEIAKKLNAR